MAADQGLRERKKQRTRELIVDRAMALFDERGFEHVTIADIAAAADIAPRTFFSYFPSKEDVVFHDFQAVFDQFEARMAARPEGETTLAVLRAFVEGVLDGMDHGDPAEQCRRRVIAGMDHESPAERCRRRVIVASPALQAHDRELITRFETELARGMAADLAEPEDSLRVRMVVAASAAALQELERVFDKDAGLPEDPMAVIAEVFVFVRGGVEALRRSAPGGPGVTS